MLRTQYANIADTLFFNKRFPDISLQNAVNTNTAGMCQLVGFQRLNFNTTPYILKLIASKTGSYCLCTGFFSDIKSKPFKERGLSMDCDIIRTDKEGNFQWSVTLDRFFGNRYQSVYLEESVIVDEEENLYFTGFTNKKLFLAFSSQTTL